MPEHSFLDFFAGSGLVSEALKRYFKPAWANDICPKKSVVYAANHDKGYFHLGSISEVNGATLPQAQLSWASFPCQDLSLAGRMGGIDAARSGLVWQWLRVMDEMDRRPPVVVAENVTGLLSARGGEDYRLLHEALTDRGYRVGPVVLDASHWVPQSRQRVFVIGVRGDVDIDDASDWRRTWAHTKSLMTAVRDLEDVVLWRLPKPPARKSTLEDIIDFTAQTHERVVAARNISLIPERHWNRLQTELKTGRRVVTGYKRTRNGQQCLELRFDGVAGCLRTPEGGSSRQLLIFPTDSDVQTRLLSVREAARLMGVHDSYKIPGSYNEGYKAMGDAVAVPVARYLAKHLLQTLATRAKNAASVGNLT